MSKRAAAKLLPGPAPRVVEYVPRPEGVEEADHQAVRAALTGREHESAADALDLHGTPVFLERLAEYPEDHPYRAGVRFKVYLVAAFGKPRYVPIDWRAARKVPTEDVLAELIVASRGAWPAGDYLVRCMFRNRALADVNLPIGEPLELAGRVTGDAGGAEHPAFRLLGQVLPQLGAGRQSSEDAEGRLDDIEASLRNVAAAVEKLHAKVQEHAGFLGHALQLAEGSGQFAGIAALLKGGKELLAGITGGAQPPAAAPAAAEGFTQ